MTDMPMELVVRQLMDSGFRRALEETLLNSLNGGIAAGVMLIEGGEMAVAVTLTKAATTNLCDHLSRTMPMQMTTTVEE